MTFLPPWRSPPRRRGDARPGRRRIWCRPGRGVATIIDFQRAVVGTGSEVRAGSFLLAAPRSPAGSSRLPSCAEARTACRRCRSTMGAQRRGGDGRRWCRARRRGGSLRRGSGRDVRGWRTQTPPRLCGDGSWLPLIQVQCDLPSRAIRRRRSASSSVGGAFVAMEGVAQRHDALGARCARWSRSSA